jgi:hypothetical protein
MSSFTIAAVAFSCVFGGALVGMYFRNLLREHRLSSETTLTHGVSTLMK